RSRRYPVEVGARDRGLISTLSTRAIAAVTGVRGTARPRRGLEGPGLPSNTESRSGRGRGKSRDSAVTASERKQAERRRELPAGVTPVTGVTGVTPAPY